MTPIETVLAFMDRINQCDPDQLAELMTEDHVFTDSLGQTMRGRASDAKRLARLLCLLPRLLGVA